MELPQYKIADDTYGGAFVSQCRKATRAHGSAVKRNIQVALNPANANRVNWLLANTAAFLLGQPCLGCIKTGVGADNDNDAIRSRRPHPEKSSATGRRLGANGKPSTVNS